MSAINQFTLVGTALTDFGCPFPNAKVPEQCFQLEVPNGDRAPFLFAVFLNPISKFNEMSSIRGKTVAVSGMLRSYPPKDPKNLPMTSVVAYDIRILPTMKARKKGDYV